MAWRKLGRAFDPTGKAPWMQTHAALPFAVPDADDRLKVYCGGRDSAGRGQTGHVYLDLSPERVELAQVAAEPDIRFGDLGLFDDRGALPSCFITMDDRDLCFYTGVMLGQTVPFYYFVGLAESLDGGRSWQKTSLAPVLPFSAVDPYLTASPFVLHDGGRFRMWYMSGTEWRMEGESPKHFYLLKYAESENCIEWKRTGKVIVDYAEGEYAISRPSVLKEQGRYLMWFASRGNAYRIQCAESRDGEAWERVPASIDVSESGWDSEMICYPHVFEYRGHRYMLYNGNGYGRTGFGVAVWQQ